MKKKWIIGIAVTAAAALALLIPLTAYVGNISRTKAAFDSGNRRYDRVQIVISQKGKDRTPVPGDGIYNDDISLDDGIGNQPVYDIEDAVTVIKDGEVYSETTATSPMYFYFRDGEEYVLSFFRNYAAEDAGEWVEQPAKDTNEVKWFDFAALDQIDLRQLEQDGRQFTAKAEYLEELLAVLLHLDENIRGDYRTDKIYFVLEDSRILKIHMEFAYRANLYMEYDYVFTYEDTTVVLPEIGSSQG